jgi:outer membrane protein TolC
MKVRPEITVLLLALQLGAPAHAQRPSAPPTSQQKDAARPPGSEQRGVIPKDARPTPQNPAAPPGSQTTSPQSPPGVESPQSPPGVESPQSPPGAESPQSPPGVDLSQSDPEQVLRGSPLMSDRPLPPPPLPSLKRLGVGPGNALELSLYDAVRLALENNTDIEVARDNVRLSETTLRSLQGVYDPIISISPQLNRSLTPSTSSLAGAGASGVVADTDFTLTPSLTKRFQTGGGNYQFFFNNLRRTTDSTVNILRPFYSSSLGVTFTQPLWRDRAIDQSRRDIRVQRKRLSQSDADFRLQTINVIAQVQQAYWELIFALRDQQNQLDNLTLAREQLQIIEARIKNGLSAPLERAEAETQIATNETTLLAATNYVTVTENNLKQIMLRNPRAPEWGRQIAPTDQPTVEAVPISLPDLLDEARANRPELHRLDLQQDINHLDVQFYKNQTRPRVDVAAAVSTLGLAGTVQEVPIISGDPSSNASAFLLDQVNQLRAAGGLPPVAPSLNRTVAPGLVGGYGRMLRNLGSLKTYDVVVGVTIQFPLHNRTAKANLAAAKIESEQTGAARESQEQAIESDVRNAAQTVETTRQQVQSARAARQSAEVQLAGEQKLYQTGLSTTYLVFQRQNQLVTARTVEVRAETDYTKAVANLQRATSTTLTANHVTVAAPQP